ncbi:aspartate/glutamate racemase family protein [Streptomyces lienomycini]|uniref:Aspartate/glutamate racemase family protein n=1 Tax=Streptomyces lienomycini TaxID=284035 RepID=A0ABV9WLW9_9ACTN|nr:aspartate/glutamate racemase family protein [Streptomyces lienomycini]
MLALLHTSPVHVPVFDALRDEAHPGLELRHHVDAELLEKARRDGPAAVTGAVVAVLRRAVAEGARAVLCTCSTIGGVAEAATAEVGVPVLRVDRPMAARAVAAGPRVVVLAALESTLAPTAALIEEEARRAGRPVEVRSHLVDGAWRRFEAGDVEGYLRRVADAADAVTGADVIVLAQASMAPARESTKVRVPVLASPAPGLAAGAVAARAGHQGLLGHPGLLGPPGPLGRSGSLARPGSGDRAGE